MHQPKQGINTGRCAANMRYHHEPSQAQTRQLPGLILLTLFILFGTFATALADENYYQIINDSWAAVDENFVTDRGYSVYLNYDGQRFLFDVGHKKKSFLGNMEAAGIGLDELDFVVLSHRHPDHIRGWSFLRKAQATLPIYVAAGGGFTHIPEVSEVSDYLKIGTNIFVMHTHDDEGTTGLTDELSLVIRTGNGPYLFTSNSHTDFFAKVDKAKQLTGQEVFFHSGATAQRFIPDEKIFANAKKMKALNIKKVSPSHSSPRHNEVFKEVFGPGYMPAAVGKKVELEPYQN